MNLTTVHGYVIPPHCSARRQTTDGSNDARPKRSRFCTRSVQEVNDSLSRFGGRTEAKKNKCDLNSDTKRQFDIDVPTPGDSLSQSLSNQKTKRCGKSTGGWDEANHDRALCWQSDEWNEGKGTDQQARTSQASNRTTHNQGWQGWRVGAAP